MEHFIQANQRIITQETEELGGLQSRESVVQKLLRTIPPIRGQTTFI